MRIYISGPITGTQDYKSRFLEAEKTIKAAGHTAVNPVEAVQLPGEWQWNEYMHIDLALLELCDAIYMQKGWNESQGASLEFEYAFEHKKIILFEGGEMIA